MSARRGTSATSYYVVHGSWRSREPGCADAARRLAILRARHAAQQGAILLRASPDPRRHRWNGDRGGHYLSAAGTAAPPGARRNQLARVNRGPTAEVLPT